MKSVSRFTCWIYNGLLNLKRCDSIFLPSPGLWVSYCHFLTPSVAPVFSHLQCQGLCFHEWFLDMELAVCFLNFLFFPQPEELTNALEISNIVFTSLFALEMLLKLLVYGPFGYIKNPYNIFDGIIVVIRYKPWAFFMCVSPHLAV